MPESWNINILMPLRESIGDPSTNPPKPMFQLSGVHCKPTLIGSILGSWALGQNRTSHAHTRIRKPQTIGIPATKNRFRNHKQDHCGVMFQAPLHGTASRVEPKPNRVKDYVDLLTAYRTTAPHLLKANGLFRLCSGVLPTVYLMLF